MIDEPVSSLTCKANSYTGIEIVGLSILLLALIEPGTVASKVYGMQVNKLVPYFLILV